MVTAKNYLRITVFILYFVYNLCGRSQNSYRVSAIAQAARIPIIKTACGRAESQKLGISFFDSDLKPESDAF